MMEQFCLGRAAMLGLAVAFAGLGVWQAAPAIAADIEGDQFYDVNTVIAAGDTVKGNVLIVDATLYVLGTVEGNILQLGRGGVVVDGGLVTGNIEETGTGGVEVKSEGIVEGNIDETTGRVRIEGGSLVKGKGGVGSLDTQHHLFAVYYSPLGQGPHLPIFGQHPDQ